MHMAIMLQPHKKLTSAIVVYKLQLAIIINIIIIIIITSLRTT